MQEDTQAGMIYAIWRTTPATGYVPAAFVRSAEGKSPADWGGARNVSAGMNTGIAGGIIQAG